MTPSTFAPHSAGLAFFIIAVLANIGFVIFLVLRKKRESVQERHRRQDPPGLAGSHSVPPVRVATEEEKEKAKAFVKAEMERQQQALNAQRERDRNRVLTPAAAPSPPPPPPVPLKAIEADILQRWLDFQLTQHLAPPAVGTPEFQADQTAFLADYLKTAPPDVWRLRNSEVQGIRELTRNGALLPPRPKP